MAARAHMIKLTETREITPYLWVHPDEERWYPNNLERSVVMPCRSVRNQIVVAAQGMRPVTLRTVIGDVVDGYVANAGTAGLVPDLG
jgi:hypothetical protein